MDNAISDVGLGWWPNQRVVGRWAIPAALQGIDITIYFQELVNAIQTTRITNVKANPAALLSLAWYESGNGKGTKNMVVLPYKDRLELFSKYLQQLVMESIGKEHDLDGNVVNQGIVVLGNKGATDQHSYVQQLQRWTEQFLCHIHRGFEGWERPKLEG